MMKRLRSCRGFSLAEVLIVVAIIAILCAISVGGILSQIKSIRQMRMDATARTIYTAAQNRLTELYSSGNMTINELCKGTAPSGFTRIEAADKPLDWGEDTAYGGDDGVYLWYVSSDKDSTSDNSDVKHLLLPDNAISDDLYNDSWVIEFNPDGGYVYAVFYSHQQNVKDFYSDKAAAADVSLKEVVRAGRKSRMNNFNAEVGYYGGNINVNKDYNIDELTVTINTDNAEELGLSFTTYVPPKYRSNYIDYVIKFEGAVSGATQTYTLNGNYVNTSRRVANFTIDSLKPDRSFYDLFCKNGRSNMELALDDSTAFTASKTENSGDFIPGEDVKITLTATVRDNNVVQPKTATQTVNSLFADSTNASAQNTDQTVKVAYGRHLQNLNTATSHVNDITLTAASKLVVTGAVQTDDIDLAGSEWTNAYGSRPFVPIVNEQLDSYDGGTSSKNDDGFNRIKNLTTGAVTSASIDAATGKYTGAVVPAENAGLFGTFYGTSLKNIAMTDPAARGTANAGAIAATVYASGSTGAGALNIENCRVYMTSSTAETIAKAVEDRAPSETTDSTAYELTVNKAIADNATIVCSNGSAGGFIGRSERDLSINKSFASLIINTNADAKTDDSAPSDGKYCAGGLVGSEAGSIAISSSYADGYVSGTYIGGLAGYTAGGGSIEGSYAAGFAVTLDHTRSSAGFMLNDSAVSMKGSYTIFDLGNLTSNTAGTISRYGTINGSGTADAVYYSNSGAANTSISSGITELSKSSELKKTTGTDVPYTLMNNALSSGTDQFTFDTGTTAYNIKPNMNLTRYDYPQIGSLTHIGDWIEREIEEGTLVYYEQYADGSMGFASGSGISTLSSAKTVVEDGYALVYTAGTLTGSNKPTVKVYFNSTTASGTAASMGGTVSSAVIANPGETGWDKADFWKLGADIDDYGVDAGGKVTDNGVDADGRVTESSANTGVFKDFYVPIVVQKGSGTTEEDYYYFNPHFAKTATAKLTELTEANRPDFKDTTGKKSISVRSARQLYLMSLYYQSYSAVTARASFKQELNINYAEYKAFDDKDARLKSAMNGYLAAAGITIEGKIETDNDNTVTVSNVISQPGIGTGAVPFAAEYDGGCYTITGLSIVKSDADLYAGLFGRISGTLKNIVFTADYSRSEDTPSYGIACGGKADGNGQIAFIGAIAGYADNTASITNCAAAGFVMTSYAYNYAELNHGGFIGYNGGSISRCSSDIPVIKVRTNGGADANVGGFVGYNSGDIDICYALSFENVGRSASDTVGNVKIGGFAAEETGTISGSYCITARTSENVDNSNISGFAPSGRGSVTRCMYVDGGSYYYVDSIRSYNIDSENNPQAGLAITGTKLEGLIDSTESPTLGELDESFSKATSSRNCKLTRAKLGDSEDAPEHSYPYPAIVRGSDGSTVHYGEWAFASDYADVGFVYWEHEVGGSNSGYHFYAVDENGEIHTTLCEAHDDGGVIKDYGYGYYYQSSQAVSANWENVNLNDTGDKSTYKSNFEVAENNTDAIAALKKQFGSSYEFVVYSTTQVEPESTTSSGTAYSRRSDKGMFLINEPDTAISPAYGSLDKNAYATCRLSYQTGTGAQARKYVFVPFFAKSMTLYSYVADGGSETVIGIQEPGHADGDSYDSERRKYENSQSSSGSSTSGDTSVPEIPDYMKSYGFPFEIRSTEQLQNINWRTDTLDAVTEVTEEDAAASDSCTRLGNSYTISYNTNTSLWGVTGNNAIGQEEETTYTVDGVQHTETWRCTAYSRSGNFWNYKYNYTYTVIACDHAKTAESDSNYLYLKWYTYKDGVTINTGGNYYWKQTHDTDAASKKTLTGNSAANFAPIGGLYDEALTVNWSDPVSKPYIAYFNGDYNGASYKIQNIKIASPGQTVGLFGTAASASLRNIILYSGNGSTIQTTSDGKNWYCLGGLAGFAARGTIENCAVAGYTIQDNRIYSGAGDADVGGLIGFCATNITRCSSVNDIIINRSYAEDSNYTNSGNVFTGGMAGICPGTISQSYSGGEIQSLSTDSKVYVYIGGFIGGEWFRASGLQYLTGYLDLEHKLSTAGCLLPDPTIRNCYSYTRLPKQGSNRVESVCPLASIGNLNSDKAANPEPIKVINSFYYGLNANGAAQPVSASIKGNYYNYKYYNANGIEITPNTQANLASIMSLGYSQMSDHTTANGLLQKLNAGGASFATVTVTENGGAQINGKYSFPGSDTELKGQNYPFPTVITQEDPFDSDSTVNVHYGRWPKGSGIFADSYSAQLDLLSGTSGSYDYSKDIAIRYYEEADGGSTAKSMTTRPTISYAQGTSSGVVECSLTEATEGSVRYYILTVNGMSEGYETINVSYGSYTLSINVSVTAEMTIKLTRTGTSSTENVVIGTPAEYTPVLMDRNGNTITGLTADNWEAATADGSIASAEITKDTSGNIIVKVTGEAVGSTSLTVTAKNVKPTNPNSKAALSSIYRQDINVVSPESTANVLFSVDELILNPDENKPVAVDAGTAAASDSVSLANFNYWSNEAASNEDVNAGRTFTGWVAEDGSAVNSSTVIDGTVTLNASWKCTEIVFYDRADGGAHTECGRLYYYAGSYYTDSSLTELAEQAPQPLVHENIETFAGYYTAESGGTAVSKGDSSLVANALSGMADENTAQVHVYAHWGEASDTAAIEAAQAEALAEAAAKAEAEVAEQAEAATQQTGPGAQTDAASESGASGDETSGQDDTAEQTETAGQVDTAGQSESTDQTTAGESSSAKEAEGDNASGQSGADGRSGTAASTQAGPGEASGSGAVSGTGTASGSDGGSSDTGTSASDIQDAEELHESESSEHPTAAVFY